MQKGEKSGIIMGEIPAKIGRRSGAVLAVAISKSTVLTKEGISRTDLLFDLEMTDGGEVLG